ncbi:MAG: aminotransferase class I/II-fold pyridoxal phosphate-dependent enzyme [Fimbriimonas sp.]
MKLTEQVIAGRSWLCFHGNDYHRLARHPKVLETATVCLAQEGLSVSASRRTTGNHPLYGELEESLAEFLGLEAAILIPSGYLANQAAMSAVQGTLYLPSRHHPSLHDAARGRAAVIVEPSSLPAEPDSWFAFDPIEANTGRHDPSLAGAAAQIPNLVIDDCHGIGVVGDGRGFRKFLTPAPSQLLLTGTLSKAFGCFGGFIGSTKESVAEIRRQAGAYVGSTPFPLPIAAGALAAISVLRAEPERYEIIARHRTRVAQGVAMIQDADWMLPSLGAIVSCPVSSRFSQPELSARLEHAGIFPPFVQYPGAPAGGHFRFTVSSAHTDEEVDRLLEALSL